MLTQITLTNFRNHKSLRLDADAKIIALAGKNGAGKTNILEAVSLLNGGTGLRHSAVADIAKFGETNWAASAKLKDEREIAVFWNGEKNRRAKLNGEFVPLGELSENLGIVWLAPSTDLLFLDEPKARRGFLDNLVSGFDPKHAGRVARMTKLLSERAFALKNGWDGSWLDAIETHLTQTMAAVADARVRFAGELNHFFSFGEIRLSGLAENRLINGEKAGDFEIFYKNYLSENRFLLAEKQTIDGAHRSDFSALNKTLGLAADKTSSGQMKLLLNNLIIAYAKMLNAKRPNFGTLILLDEADSHLDENARAELFAALSDTSAQIWMTGTNPAAFAGITECKLCEL